MIYRKFIPLFLALLFLMIFISPQTSIADDDDFDVDYSFSPTVVGWKGADVQLRLTIENTGTTDITWINVIINTDIMFSQMWTATIRPGMTRTVSFLVPFGEGDLNEEKILQVSMNNNSSANPDGVKMYRFEIEGLSSMFDSSLTISPARSEYNVGDTIEIIHSFTNNITTHASTSSQTRVDYYIDSAPMGFFTYTIGNIFPEDTYTGRSFLTLDESLVGELLISSYIFFTMMGKDYDYSGSYTTITIVAPEPDIDFTANLTAAPTEIDSGDTVAFTINLENTGDDTITAFEVRNSEGGVVAATESMPSGGSGSVPVSAQIYEASDISYVVVAYSGDYYESIETNTVSITVVEPEESEVEPTATPTLTPSPTQEPSATPSESIETTPTSSVVNEISAEQTNLDESLAQDSEDADDSNSGLIILIAMSILAVIALIIIIILVVGRRLNKDGSMSDFQ